MKKTVFLISGKARSGKNSIADFMCEEVKNLSYFSHSGIVLNIAYEVKKYSEQDFSNLSCFLNDIANEIDSRVNILFDSNPNDCLNNYLNKLKEITNKLRIHPLNYYEDKTELSRILLQTYGTNIIRDRVDKDFWCKKFKEKINKLHYDFIFVADVRFENEIDSISDSIYYDSYTIRVNKNNSNIDKHPSKIDLDNYQGFNYIVDNTGTLEDLRGSAKFIIKDILDNSNLLNKGIK